MNPPHVTTFWSAAYGLPDPQPVASAVRAVRPGDVEQLAHRARQTAGSLREVSSPADRAGAVLRQGWSASAPQVALKALMSLAESAAAACEETAHAIQSCATALSAARDAVETAYARADSTISSQSLQAFLPLVGPPMISDRQQAVVLSLYEEISRARSAVDDAAARLIAEMGPDPRPALPPFVGDVVPTATTAAGSRASPDRSAEDRDAANRAALAADLSSPSQQRRVFAQRVLAALQHAEQATPGAAELLLYDPDRPAGQGGAAIGLGGVASADQIAVLVPGVANSPSEMSDTLDTAQDLITASDGADPGARTAAVAWLGYDVPLSWPHDPGPVSVSSALGDSALAVNAIDASLGGAALAAFCTELRDVMSPSAGLTLIGHSYGSTVVSQAALRLDRSAAVDDIVLLAAPGAGYGVHDASGYPAVSADHVYALAFPADPVPNSITDLLAGAITPLGAIATAIELSGDGSPFGPDPVGIGYGAQVIDAPSGITPSTAIPAPLRLLGALSGPAGAILAEASGAAVDVSEHAMGNYLGGAALTAVAAVVVGAYTQVPVKTPRR